MRALVTNPQADMRIPENNLFTQSIALLLAEANVVIWYQDFKNPNESSSEIISDKQQGIGRCLP